MRASVTLIRSVLPPVLVLAGILLGVGAGSARPAGDDLAAVLDEWDKRNSNTHSAKVRLEGTVTIPKGSFNDLPVPRQNKGDLPPQDYTSEKRNTYLLQFENNWVRKETSNESFHFSLLTWVRHFQVQLYDGSEVKVYEPKEPNTSKQYTPHEFQPDLWIQSKSYTNLVLETTDYPLFIARGIIGSSKWTPSTRQMKRPLDRDGFREHAKTLHAGRPHLIVRTAPMPSDKHATFDEYWVDLERKGAVSRWVRWTRGKIYAQVDTQHRETSSGWMPSAWTTTLYWDGKVQHSEHMQVAEFTLNPQFDIKDFRMSPKAGMVVLDVNSHRTYLVDEGGQERDVVAGQIVDGPPTGLRRWRWVAALAGCGVVLGCGLLLWRRRGVKCLVSQAGESAPGSASGGEATRP